MLKRIHKFLRVVSAALFGNFLISSLLNYLDYRENPLSYEVRSAPWYTYGALPSFGLFLGFAVISFLVGVLEYLHAKREEPAAPETPESEEP